MPLSEPSRASIAPWLSVPSGTAAVKHYQAAFGAAVVERMETDAGEVVVAQLSIEGARFWVSEDPDTSPSGAGGGPVRMILTVEDPDAVFARAVAAGASVVAPIHEGHGWRVGRIADPFGHHWEVGRPLAG